MKASDHFKNYVELLIDGLVSVDMGELNRITDVLIDAYSNGKRVYVCGNGGSAAISDHFNCDHSKCVHLDTGLLPEVYPLITSVALITAIANDISYDKIFSLQLEMLGSKDDVLVVISSSGNSPNIIEALKAARIKGLTTIAFVGFDGGKAKELADYCLHVNAKNYGAVEDAHQALMHVTSQYIRMALQKVDTVKL